MLEKRDTTSEAYNEKLDVEHLYTDDQKNYIVEIDQTTSSYQEGDFLRLSLQGYTEVIGEVLYMEPLGEYSYTNIRSFSVGTSISNYSIGYNRVRGYSKYNVSGLPADFTYKKSTKDVKINGKFTQTGTYKIIFRVNISESPDIAYWYNAQGNVVGQDRFLYAKPGTYTLQTIRTSKSPMSWKQEKLII